MSRISSILVRARDSLADPRKERWSDARLVRLIDEAQKAIARRFELFRGETTIALDTETTTYQLPDDVWRITRASFEGICIPMLTYSELDHRNPEWMSDTGPKVEAIVFNNRSMNEIRVYPAPNDEFPNEFFDIIPIYGVTDSFEDIQGNQFGIMSDLVERPGSNVTFTSPFGVVSDVAILKELHLQYVRDPITVVTDLDDLELSTTFDTVIKHYVVGMAFLDDLDSQNQERGQRALALYERDVDLLGEKTGPTNSTRAANVRSTYRSFV